MANADKKAAEKSYLTMDDMAAELQVSKSTLYDWIATNRGPQTAKLPNGAIRVRRDKWIEWLCQLEQSKRK